MGCQFMPRAWWYARRLVDLRKGIFDLCVLVPRNRRHWETSVCVVAGKVSRGDETAR